LLCLARELQRHKETANTGNDSADVYNSAFEDFYRIFIFLLFVKFSTLVALEKAPKKSNNNL